jgi:hypothetical protein
MHSISKRTRRSQSERVGSGLRRLVLFAGCVGWMVLSGCAIHRIEVVEPGTSVELGEDEGLLIVHIDTDVMLERVSIRTGTIATDLPEGQHLWIVRTRAGNLGWRKVDFGKELGRRAYIFVEQMNGTNDEEFTFDIEAGSINYPGSLIVRTHKSIPGLHRRWVSVRNRNHSAMAIRRLLHGHSALLGSLPIRYGGSSGDQFLEFYTEERILEKSDIEEEAN